MWTEEEYQKLKKLHSQKMWCTEIAEKMGRRPASVRWAVKKLGLKSTRETCRDRMAEWNNKHAHLREAVLRYYRTHTIEETGKRFGLTTSELKSCLSYAYHDPRFRHIRKDTRDHAPWSTDQLLFLLRHAGLKNRDWIADKIGRGNRTCIKERMQALGIASRTIQGITCSQFQVAFGRRPEFYLKTDAGPDGGPMGSLPTKWKIVPWVWLDQELKSKRLKTAKEFRMLVDAMAKFQEWIHGGGALPKMKRICKAA